MAEIFSSAGAKFYIGPANGVADIAAEYAALTYVEVGEVSDIGEFGDESNAVTFTRLSDSRVQKKKGSRDAGTIPVTMARATADLGQQALVAAEKSPNDYAFKVTLNDEPAGGDNPTTFYFRGQVMSYRTSVGAADNIITAVANVGINSEILEVPAA